MFIKIILELGFQFFFILDVLFSHLGPLYSMKHLKQEVETIKNGVECGLSIQNHDIIPKEGDVISCYQFVKVPQKTEWDPGF